MSLMILSFTNTVCLLLEVIELRRQTVLPKRHKITAAAAATLSRQVDFYNGDIFCPHSSSLVLVLLRRIQIEMQQANSVPLEMPLI